MVTVGVVLLACFLAGVFWIDPMMTERSFGRYAGTWRSEQNPRIALELSQIDLSHPDPAMRPDTAYCRCTAGDTTLWSSSWRPYGDGVFILSYTQGGDEHGYRMEGQANALVAGDPAPPQSTTGERFVRVPAEPQLEGRLGRYVDRK